MVLDADFFHYTPEMKAKIHEVFRFMYASNFRRRGLLFRMAAMLRWTSPGNSTPSRRGSRRASSRPRCNSPAPSKRAWA